MNYERDGITSELQFEVNNPTYLMIGAMGPNVFDHDILYALKMDEF